MADSELQPDMVTEKLLIYGLSVSIFVLVCLPHKISAIKLVLFEIQASPGEKNYAVLIGFMWIALLITFVRFALRCWELRQSIFQPSQNFRIQVGELATAFAHAKEATNPKRLDEFNKSASTTEAHLKRFESALHLLAEEEKLRAPVTVPSSMARFNRMVDDMRLKLGDILDHHAKLSGEVLRANTALRKLDVSSKALWTRVHFFDMGLPLAAGVAGLALPCVPSTWLKAVFA